MATGPLIILIGGGGLLAYLIYDWLQYRLRRRRRKEVQESGVMGKVSYDWRVYVTVILSVVTAYLYARPIERVTETVTGFDPIVEILGAQGAPPPRSGPATTSSWPSWRRITGRRWTR